MEREREKTYREVHEIMIKYSVEQVEKKNRSIVESRLERKYKQRCVQLVDRSAVFPFIRILVIA